jgi:hypothetical protein
MLVFRPSFVIYCPSNLLSCSPRLPSFPKSKYSIYREFVAGRGWGLLSCVGDHILQEFNTLLLTRFRPYKIATPPQTKTLEGRRPQTDKHLPQNPFRGQFFRFFISLIFLRKRTCQPRSEIHPGSRRVIVQMRDTCQTSTV